MKVLWLSSSNTLFNEKGDRAYNGKGWIASLQRALKQFGGDDVELGVAFVSGEDSDAIVQDGVTYFRIKKRSPKGFGKLYYNFRGGCIENYDDRIREIADRFSPDVIHVFGCESKLSSAIASIIEIPVIVHLQGILNEYIKYFYPKGISGKDMIIPKTFVNEVILRNGFIHLSEDYIRRADEEKRFLAAMKYAMGRTEWDRNVCRTYSEARYFHVDEVMRDSFYDNAGKWSLHPERRVLNLFTTISETPYKGLDLILKSAGLLKKRGVDFKWKVAGIRSDSGILGIFEKKFGLAARECNVFPVGILDEHGIVTEMLDSDIYVHPSYIDNSPNSLCEAQMLGIPVIATAVGGVPTLIEDRKTGVLVTSGDEMSLVSEIERLYGDKRLMVSIGTSAASAAEKRHDKVTIVESLLSVYRSII